MANTSLNEGYLLSPSRENDVQQKKKFMMTAPCVLLARNVGNHTTSFMCSTQSRGTRHEVNHIAYIPFMKMEAVIRKLYDAGAVRFGEFKLKSGIFSPVYFDLRVVVSYPQLMRQVSELLWNAAKDSPSASFTSVCGVPYTALPLATIIAVNHDIPMLIKRKEPKDYGTKKMIEGHFKSGDYCLIVEDVVTSGSSVYETAEVLNTVGLKVKDAVVLLNREQGGEAMLANKGIKLRSVFTLSQILKVLHAQECVTDDVVKAVKKFLKDNQEPVPQDKPESVPRCLPYAERAAMMKNVIGKRLLEIMAVKQTNLCLSADVTSSSELLSLAELTGPYICMLKTHIDILDDFRMSVITNLKSIAEKHSFLIFEDRKFADIGNTVKHQYSSGIFKISEWADIINAHSVPGVGVIQGLAEESRDKPKACLMIAQMSSKGALLTGDYTKATVNMAKEFSDFVLGFICTSKVCDDPSFLHFTPGVNLHSQGDALGQQYLTPHEVIANRGCDIIIVGRGIYKAQSPAESARLYQEAGHIAYTERLR